MASDEGGEGGGMASDEGLGRHSSLLARVLPIHTLYSFFSRLPPSHPPNSAFGDRSPFYHLTTADASKKGFSPCAPLAPAHRRTSACAFSSKAREHARCWTHLRAQSTQARLWQVLRQPVRTRRGAAEVQSLPAWQCTKASRPLAAGHRMGARLGTHEHASSGCGWDARRDTGERSRARSAAAQRARSQHEPVARGTAIIVHGLPLTWHGGSGSSSPLVLGHHAGR